MRRPSLLSISPDQILQWVPEFVRLGGRHIRTQMRLLGAAVLVGIVAGLGAGLIVGIRSGQFYVQTERDPRPVPRAVRHPQAPVRLMPPSTPSTCPVSQVAPGSAIATIHPAISGLLPMRPSGTCLANPCFI
jgi:hypothetical protein